MLNYMIQCCFILIVCKNDVYSNKFLDLIKLSGISGNLSHPIKVLAKSRL